MIFEQGFQKIEAAAFPPKQLGGTLRYLADMVESTGASDGGATLGYDDGSAPVGSLVPEIVLRVVRKKDKEEAE